MTAATHLALLHPAIQHCDFNTLLLFTADPVVGSIRYRAGGVVEVPTAPGLGVRSNEQWLAATARLNEFRGYVCLVR